MFIFKCKVVIIPYPRNKPISNILGLYHKLTSFHSLAKGLSQKGFIAFFSAVCYNITISTWIPLQTASSKSQKPFFVIFLCTCLCVCSSPGMHWQYVIFDLYLSTICIREKQTKQLKIAIHFKGIITHKKKKEKHF